jgi:hypothetical protein
MDNRLNAIVRPNRGTFNPTHTLWRCANTEDRVGYLHCRNIDGLSAKCPTGFRHDSSEKE